ncbi:MULTISPECIES: hypothetical protein [Bacillus]|uniref:hypothetical protein n=1 Tax=Bacillus TaxID=1386 RepID=UPI0004684663|nr:MULTISPECIES: hypothetical protein [Bacillus]MED1410339.1 hypothetical protein [Bacillus paramycoides]MED1463395.1 hypothetical protein [Bacillus paramycoides]MED1494813.1 hypothetical protein [Bacillus paramycoides]
MKKITYVCVLSILSLSLIGCTSTSTTDNTPKTKQENSKNTIQLNSADITNIELLATTTNPVSKAQTDNEEMIKSIASTVQNGTPKTITLNQEKKQSAHSTITVTYKGDSKEEYLVWVDNKDQITIAKNEKKDKVEGVTLNIKGTKMMKDFFKNDKA